jgi:hypothetical protein
LNDRICVIALVRVGGKKPVPDILHNDAAEVGCSGRVDKMPLELSAPSCKELAKVKVRHTGR